MLEKLLPPLIAMALFWASPSWAIEATVQARTGLCNAPKANCTPLFYLNPDEKVQVLSSDLEQIWAEIRYGDTRRGWLELKNLKLHAPKTFEAQTVAQLPQSNSHFLRQGNQLWVQSGAQLFEFDFKQGQLKPQPTWATLSKLPLDQFENGWKNVELPTFSFRETVDQQTFLQSVSWNNPIPEFKTLLRLSEPEQPTYTAATDTLLLVLAKGQGWWGKSLLVGLDRRGIPILVLEQAEQIQLFLPSELNQRLMPQSFQLLGLDQQGQVYIKAIERKHRKTLVMAVKPQLSGPWPVISSMIWPSESPAPTDKNWPALQMASLPERSFLAIPEPGQKLHHIHYYAATGQRLSTFDAAELQDLILDPDGFIWTIQAKKLLKWTPVF